MDITNFNSDQHLNNEELIAYKLGNLSNKEMHRLELHLVDCELCNDALEGLANIDQVVLDKHLSNIRIKTKTKPRDSISIKQIMAIAASVILIAVVSIVLLNLPQEEPAIAENRVAIEKEQPKEKEIEKSSDKIEKPDSSLIPEKSQLAITEPAAEQITGVSAPVTARIAQPASEEEVERSLDISVADTEVVDSSSTILLANTVNNDSVISEDISIAALTAQDQGDAARSKKMAAPAAVVESTELQEVQTVDLEQESSVYEPAEPEKGNRSYNRYLKRNLKYPEAATENNIEGNVILEIEISEDGLIIGTNVLESLGFGCDKEAIRLINEGPNWLPAKKSGLAILDKVSITVTFKL